MHYLVDLAITFLLKTDIVKSYPLNTHQIN